MYVSGIIPKEQKKEPELCVNNNNKTKASKTGLFLYETVMSYRQNTDVFYITKFGRDARKFSNDFSCAARNADGFHI